MNISRLLVTHAAALAVAIGAPATSFAAKIAHEGFDAHPFVNNLLITAGHTPTTLTAANVETGALLSGSYDVFVISRNSIACSGPTPAYANAVAAYVAAGGNVVTEWAGGPMFFTSDHTSEFCGGDIRLGLFDGIVHAGNGRGPNTPIDLLTPSHPVTVGLPDPMADGDGSDFMYWIESPDSRLEVLGRVTGSGGAFPTAQQLPVMLTGCSNKSRFVFGLHDWGDTITTSPRAQTFLRNAVAYAAEGCNPCPETPNTLCLSGGSASFQMRNDDDDTKDSFKWKISRGDELLHASLGAPNATRMYAVCVYDEVEGESSRVASFRISPGPLWVSKDPKGFKYTDKLGTESGITKAALKAGAPGKSGVQFAGKGINLPLPAPATGSKMFAQDSRVTVQLVDNESSLCISSEFSIPGTNTPESFKASY